MPLIELRIVTNQALALTALRVAKIAAVQELPLRSWCITDRQVAIKK
jgi:hypothetical protein